MDAKSYLLQYRPPAIVIASSYYYYYWFSLLLQFIAWDTNMTVHGPKQEPFHSTIAEGAETFPPVIIVFDRCFLAPDAE
jgi:hypothetical protein